MLTLRRARRPLVALVALAAALGIGYTVQASDGDGPGSSSTSSSTNSPDSSLSSASSAGPATRPASAEPLAALPPEAAATVELIERGGPFPFPQNDGVVFHNFEHLLPGEPDGYYREYTVPTPGSPDRGERRIVTGSDGEFWYTDDHYESFERVDVGG
ncbi:MAG: ribonuclease [Pseudonocardiales bacterium]|nr:ribonuclease [Pseudonocardiales bacterium]